MSKQTDILCGKKNYTVVHDATGVRRITCEGREIALDMPIARRLIAMFEHRKQHRETFRSIRSSARQPLRTGMTKRILKPPFEIYNDTCIADCEGHVLSAESPEIAQAVLAVLNRAMVPVTPAKSGISTEGMLTIIEVAALRTRDLPATDSSKAFDYFAEQLRRLRKLYEEALHG